MKLKRMQVESFVESGFLVHIKLFVVEQSTHKRFLTYAFCVQLVPDDLETVNDFHSLHFVSASAVDEKASTAEFVLVLFSFVLTALSLLFLLDKQSTFIPP